MELKCKEIQKVELVNIKESKIHDFIVSLFPKNVVISEEIITKIMNVYKADKKSKEEK